MMKAFESKHITFQCCIDNTSKLKQPVENDLYFKPSFVHT